MLRSKIGAAVFLCLLSPLTAVRFADAAAAPARAPTHARAPAPAPTGVPTCKAIQVADPRVQGRSRAVQFPDGRVITVVGHHHGLRQILANLSWIQDTDLSKVSQVEMDRILKDILGQNQKVISGYSSSDRVANIKITEAETKVPLKDIVPVWKDLDIPDSSAVLDSAQDYSYLKDRMTSAHPPAFVGVESGQYFLEEILSNLGPAIIKLDVEMQNRLKSGRTSLSNLQIQDVIRSGTMGHLYLFATLPGRKDIPKFVAMEDPSTYPVEKEGESPGQLLSKLDAQLLAVDRSWAQKNKVKPFLGQLDQPASVRFGVKLLVIKKDTGANLLSAVELQKEINELRSLTPPHLLPVIGQLELFWVRELQATHNRDRASARNLVKQGSSGIHFVGRRHLLGTTRALEYLCAQELASKSARTQRSNSMPLDPATIGDAETMVTPEGPAPQ